MMQTINVVCLIPPFQSHDKTIWLPRDDKRIPTALADCFGQVETQTQTAFQFITDDHDSRTVQLVVFFENGDNLLRCQDAVLAARQLIARRDRGETVYIYVFMGHFGYPTGLFANLPYYQPNQGEKLRTMLVGVVSDIKEAERIGQLSDPAVIGRLTPFSDWVLKAIGTRTSYSNNRFRLPDGREIRYQGNWGFQTIEGEKTSAPFRAVDDPLRLHDAPGVVAAKLGLTGVNLNTLQGLAYKG